MNSIKEIIAAQEIEKVDYDKIYKIIAIIIIVILLYVAYKISNEGFTNVPFIGFLLNDFLAFISNIIKTIADLFRKIFGIFMII